MNNGERLRKLGVYPTTENAIKLRNNLMMCEPIAPHVKEKFINKLDRVIEKQLKGITA